MVYMNSENEELESYTEQYYMEIYKYCCRHVHKEDDALDITQDVFEAFCRNFSNIADDSIITWLTQTTKHKIADYYRDIKSTRDNMSDIPMDEIEDFSFDIADIETVIQKIMSELDEDEKTLYSEKFIEKLDYDVLAERYGFSEETMRKRVSRVRNKILDLAKGLLILLLFIHIKH